MSNFSTAPKVLTPNFTFYLIIRQLSCGGSQTLLPILESPKEILKIPVPSYTPLPIKWECQNVWIVKDSHQKCVKIFQCAIVFGNHSLTGGQILGLDVCTCVLLFSALIPTLQGRFYCYFVLNRETISRIEI